jgi:hypothetical protein
LDQAQAFEVPPIFIKEDADSIAAHPEMSLKVPSWMCMAERIATGSRKRVPEDGPDTWHSDDESKTDIEADKETNTYTSEMDPKLGPQRLTTQEAARQRAAYQALRSQMGSADTTTDSDLGNSIVSSQVQSPQSTRQPTPLNSDNEDEDGMAEDQLCKLKGAKKMSTKAQPPRCPSAPGTKAPPKEPKGDGTPVSLMRDDTGPSQKVSQPAAQAQGSKAVAPPAAPADQPKGAKAPPPKKGQESPVAKATQPRMQTRSQASRAGGLRSGGGLGQTDTCVSRGNPSKT